MRRLLAGRGAALAAARPPAGPPAAVRRLGGLRAASVVQEPETPFDAAKFRSKVAWLRQVRARVGRGQVPDKVTAKLPFTFDDTTPQADEYKARGELRFTFRKSLEQPKSDPSESSVDKAVRMAAQAMHLAKAPESLERFFEGHVWKRLAHGEGSCSCTATMLEKEPSEEMGSRAGARSKEIAIRLTYELLLPHKAVWERRLTWATLESNWNAGKAAVCDEIGNNLGKVDLGTLVDIEALFPTQSGQGAGLGADPKQLTRQQLRRLFKEMPGKVNAVSCYLLHSRGLLEPKVAPPLPEGEFSEIFMQEMADRRRTKSMDVLKRRRKRHNYGLLNRGYSEPERQYDAEETEFQDWWRAKSIVEDVWKAEAYQEQHRRANVEVPEREPLAARGDRLADVTAGAFRDHLLDANRPVLTHELADFDNPYMMKRSALERLVHERCVRNQLDEAMMPRLLDQLPDMVKLRSKAKLPPEVLEPLAAFRGDTRWAFDSRQRLAQKLEGASAALERALAPDASLESVVEALPENAPVDPGKVAPGVSHPWENHVGFESAVPTGTAGGTSFGKPRKELDEQLAKLRYPTLQRVAHTLPADPKWRAHVVRSIEVLERSKGWDFANKLKAVNRLKEIYDRMKPSATYSADLDEHLVVNRVPSHLKKKYARDKQYVKTFRKKFHLQKAFTVYRPSLTAKPLAKMSAAKIAFKQY